MHQQQLYAANAHDDDIAIVHVSEKYIVHVDIVNEYIEHLKHLEWVKQIRSINREKEHTNTDNKTYEIMIDLINTLIIISCQNKGN